MDRRCRRFLFMSNDNSKKNVQNPDFLWDLDNFNKELSELFAEASADLIKDIDNMKKQISEEQEDEE